MMTQIIALSLGEPAGIGPDILVVAAQQARSEPWLVFGDASVLHQRAALLALPLVLEDYRVNQVPSCQAGHLTIVDYPCAVAVQAGVLNPLNSPGVLTALTAAARFCQADPRRALVTLPIHKAVINQAGIAFSGHTEWLAELSGVAKVVMLLGSERLKVALQTIHIPLKQVAAQITAHELTTTLAIIDTHWRRYYAKPPRILVLGLNPHAGENGYLGSEEQEIIIPTLQGLQAQGYDVLGPVAADTAFSAARLAGIDVVLAMYHDQGLAPLKAVAWGEIVNYTLGLPYIRTSVDHGVALDKAGTGHAEINSFLTALSAAATLSRRQLSP